MVKISLIPGIKQAQGISLTPQLIQSIKLFELNNIDLEHYLADQILENPFLENKDDSYDENLDPNDETTNNENIAKNDLEVEISQNESPLDDYSNIYDENSSISSNELTNIIEETVAYKKSINENLVEQANLSFSNPIDRIIAYFLIENLESDGYFKSDISEFSISLDIDEDRMKTVLSELKTFEPVGIFSETLKECLYRQLMDMDLMNDPMKYLLENLEELANGNVSKLAKICEVKESEILNMVKIIRRCSPRPINNLETDIIDTSEPDIIVKKDSSDWVVELNENTLPRILVNTGYWEELARKKISKDDKKYLAEKYASGKWLLRAVEQRAATILRVSKEIIKRQNDFLERGLAHMKPMVLKDIAKELDLHESTISRITNSKEISTPRGIFQLKFFFSKAIEGMNGGENISSNVVKNKIKKLIDGEGEKPLSDSRLVSLLKDSGINLARRTVTKYRVTMRIPPSFERKKMKNLNI
jgi:RNA polymerase sigma-54 factor